MADKLRAQQQVEQQTARYIGTGHADTTAFQFSNNVQRDSLSNYTGHPPTLQYMAIGLGQPKERVRAQFLEKAVQPIEKPPETE